jgi:protoheme IX farnesyltransferase
VPLSLAVARPLEPAALARALAVLTKIRIASLSTLSAATGYAVFARGLGWGVLSACGGTLLLSAGASVLNEWQEREADGRMERTRARPLPAGLLAPAAALVLSALLISSGFALLLAAHGIATSLLGLLAVAWYNGIYTPLKRVTALAVVPGAFIGALPPAIGWTAAGGSPSDPRILCLSFFFFVWQIPHFWLLLLLFGRDYERGGFPTLTALLSRRRLARLTFVWMITTAASSLLLPLYGLTSSPPVVLGLAASALFLGGLGAYVLRGGGETRSLWRAFHGINAYALAVMLLLAVDPYLARWAWWS